MKSLRRKAEPSMREVSRPGLLRRGFRRLKHGLVAAAVATTMAFGMPMLDRPARADPPANATKLYTVKGTTATLTEGTKSISAYVLAQNVKSMLEVQGPAKLTLRVYPVLRKTLFATSASDHQLTIKCSSGPAGGTQTVNHYSGSTKMSSVRHADVPATHVIGTPVQFTAEVGKGAQRFSLLSPMGFFEVVSVKRLATRVKRIDLAPRPRLRFRPNPPKKQKPKPKEEPRTLFTFTGDRVHYSEFGPGSNTGDLNIFEVLGHVPVSDSISLLLGAYVTSYGLVLDTSAASTSLRSLSTNGVVGMSYGSGRHYMTAYLFGGYRHLWTKLSATDGRTIPGEDKQGEYGGAASYAYNPYFEASVSAGNNQFNPLNARLRGALPWGWVKGHKPSLSVAFTWLRAAVPSNEEGMIGGADLSHNAYDIIAVADVPLFRLWKFVLTATAGGEITLADSGKPWGTGLFGGSLIFEHKGVMVSFSGMSSLEGMPFLTLNLAYRR